MNAPAGGAHHRRGRRAAGWVTGPARSGDVPPIRRLLRRVRARCATRGRTSWSVTATSCWVCWTSGKTACRCGFRARSTRPGSTPS
ncbi:conserved hypothetical protein [Mycobacterium tuberculosis EAS054]|nr:conserved hypothetical protein [Mycobacterium tuberculosis EAS054]